MEGDGEQAKRARLCAAPPRSPLLHAPFRFFPNIMLGGLPVAACASPMGKDQVLLCTITADRENVRLCSFDLRGGMPKPLRTFPNESSSALVGSPPQQTCLAHMADGCVVVAGGRVWRCAFQPPDTLCLVWVSSAELSRKSFPCPTSVCGVPSRVAVLDSVLFTVSFLHERSGTLTQTIKLAPSPLRSSLATDHTGSLLVSITSSRAIAVYREARGVWAAAGQVNTHAKKTSLAVDVLGSLYSAHEDEPCVAISQGAQTPPALLEVGDRVLCLVAHAANALTILTPNGIVHYATPA
jgi:hypothetical protein